MNSFYGGRQGHSFIISKVYKSIEEMVEDFGNANCLVGFDEYVLINTENRSLPENGDIYKRGYDLNGTIRSYNHIMSGEDSEYGTYELKSNGAEFIGNIVGPAGPAPTLVFKTFNEIEELTSIKSITFSDLDIDILIDGEPESALVIQKLKENMKREDSVLFKDKDIFTVIVSQEPYVHYYHYDNTNNTDTPWVRIPSLPELNGYNTISGSAFTAVPAVDFIYDEVTNTIKYQYNNYEKKYCAVKDENTYRDNIEWMCYTITDKNLQNSTANIGFKMVAPVFDFACKFEEPTYAGPFVVREQTEEEIKQHPFYSSWTFKIPYVKDYIKELAYDDKDNKLIIKKISMDDFIEGEGYTSTETNFEVFLSAQGDSVKNINYDKDTDELIITYFNGVEKRFSIMPMAKLACVLDVNQYDMGNMNAILSTIKNYGSIYRVENIS